MIGTTLGPYKIIEQLGAGGMGEVYLGEDTRLGRKVAIKVLPAEFASDAERLARFEQEARAAAALNHPHIAVVHDVGTESKDGSTIHFMVQEYLEGQSLRERLDKGALPVDRSLALATEVGEALVAAHKAGIVHRDLKPDNIFVTDEGHAKVLDFGLAKLTEVVTPADSQLSMSPTALGTVAGQVMGTAGYMAPEQVNGDDVDARADVFAFGAVLYEIVTGRRAFAGESVVQTLSKIAHDEPPPIAEIVKATPNDLSRIVRKCLAKAPGRRYQTAADLAIDLRQLREDVAAGVATTADHATPPTRSGQTDVSRKRAAAGLLAVGAVTLVLGYFAGRQAATPLEHTKVPPSQMEIPVSPADSIQRFLLRSMAITPDGRGIIFVGYNGAQSQLYNRPLDALVATPIAGTDGAQGPIISPDGEKILFQADGELRLVPLGGGAPTTVRDLGADAEDRSPQGWSILGNDAADIAFGATWESNETVIYSRKGGPLLRFSVVSGANVPAEPITTLQPGEGDHLTPEVLPQNRGILFAIGGAFVHRPRVMVLLPDGQHQLVVDDASDPKFVAGFLLFARQGQLMAARFDIDNLQLDGEPFLILPDVAHQIGAGNGLAASGTAHFVATPDTLAYLPGGLSAGCFQGELFWLTEGGEREPIAPLGSGTHWAPSLSRDGTKILLMRDGNLSIVDAGGGTPQALAPGSFGIWGHNDEYVVSSPRRGGNVLISTSVADSQQTELYSSPNDGGLRASSLSSDGSFLAFVRNDPMSGDDIWMLNTQTNDAEEWLATPEMETHPMISPDDDWVAYASGDGAEERIFVRRREGSGRPFMVSPKPGTMPSWSPGGDALFFIERGNGIWRVPFTMGPDGEPEAAEARNFSPTDWQFTTPVGWMDVHPEEEKMLSLRCADSLEERASRGTFDHLRIYQGWMHQLGGASGGDDGLALVARRSTSAGISG